MAKGKATDQKQITIVERRMQVLNLRRAGGSIRSISNQLGIANSTCHLDLQQALAELAEQQHHEADQLRALELDRLDALLLTVWKKAIDGDLEAVDRALKITDRRTKLLGLNLQTDQLVLQSAGAGGVDTSQLLAVLFEALQSYPEARLAVASRLEAIAASQKAQEQPETTIEGEVTNANAE